MSIKDPSTGKNVIYDSESSKFIEVGTPRYFEVRTMELRAEITASTKSIRSGIVSITIRKRILQRKRMLRLCETMLSMAE